MEFNRVRQLVSSEAVAQSNVSDYALIHSINHFPEVVCFPNLLTIRNIKYWRHM